MISFPRRAQRLAVAAAVLVLALAAACSKSSTSAGGTPTPTPTPGATGPAGSGPVEVLYAGSLGAVMTNQIKPAFQAATGYTFNGVGAGSSALASGIKSGVYQADVFISAATAPDASLMGAGNGNWISWYAPFATSALVLGYDVSSTFAPALTSRPWYEVVAMPGFRIGRTDPKTDPKGVLAAQAITETVADAASLPGANAAALNAIVASTKNVYDETGEVALMETHQLDGAFLYTIEAQAAGSTIKTVPLTGPAQGLHATYTITILNRAPHGKAAEAFVNFLLGPTGKAFLTNDAFALASPPQVTGTGVPAGVSSVIHG